jgi:lipopolysaccharide transport system ATP-binding protein
MQMRLAFSVATAIRPDILIVDEALSVGDAYFQHKSFNRIREFRKLGTTLLIVSHDKQAIQSICNRTILLNGGQLILEGEPEAVMDYYNAILAQNWHPTAHQQRTSDGKLQTVSGSGEATVADISLLNAKANESKWSMLGKLFSFALWFRPSLN